MNLLLQRFPTLRRCPWIDLGIVESPVTALDAAASLWIKRDDLCAPVLGGNKARALEYVLAGNGEAREVVTVGGIGSTHVLATAVHASVLGLRTTAFRWPHHLNPTGRQVSEAISERCVRAPVLGSSAAAFAAADCTG